MKKLKLFDKNGYVDIPAIKSFCAQNQVYFIFIYGGRGTGKTYGALKDAVTNNVPFIYLRRLSTQLKVLASEAGQPFNELNKDEGLNIKPVRVYEQLFTFHHMQIEEEKEKPAGNAIGCMSALSTFANLRSVSFSWVDEMIFDEFIPQSTERPIKDEAGAMFNAYETINRNRELQGRPPVQMLCLANSNDLGNPVFLELGLVRIAEKLRKSGNEYKIIPERHMILIDLFKSGISEQKSDTALYELTKGTEFYDMAIKNVFSAEERGRIKSMPISEYRPIVSIGEITIYRHKSRQEFYCTTLHSGAPETYGTGEKEKLRFKRHYLYLWQAYMNRKIIFEEYLCEILFDRYFN